MDVLEQFLGGKTAAQPGAPSTPSAPSTGGVISDQLLDSLRRVESGKDRFAINKETKAMGPYQFLPETVQMLHKQGIEFNPFNENEARNAAKSYLEQLVKRTGSVDKALAAYGGFITKDPTAYVQNVMQGKAEPSAPSAAPADPLEAFFAGKPAASNVPAKPSTAGAGRGSYAGYDIQAAAEAAGRSTRGEAAPEGTAVGRAAGRLFGKAIEGRRALGEIVAAPIMGAVGSVLGPVAGVIETVQSGKYGTQEGIQAGQEKAAAVQRGLMPEIRTPAAQAVLGSVQKAVEASKLPPVGTPELIGFAPLAQPATQQATQGLKQGAQAVAAPIQRNIVQPLREAAAELQVVKPGQLSKAEAEAQFAAIQGKPTVGSAGAAKVEFNPYAGQISGEESARGQFPQIKLSKTRQNVPVTEQTTRAQIANEILGDSGQVRPGVITGNEDTLRTEYTKAKMAQLTPEGELLKKQIADEQVALSNYAQQRIENTGASPTLVTPYERGERINSAFAGDDGLAGFFKGEKNNLYQEATNRTGNNPIATSNVLNLFADKQFRAGLGLKGNEGVAKAAEQLIELARTVGFKDEMGNVYAPNTVGAWTAVQKSLNSNWTRENAAVIRQINQAIERDIAGAGGLDLLKKADQLHQAEKVLFGSKGIKQIFGDIDPNGVQTATAFDAIPQKLNSMPLDQWKHIYETAEKIAKGTVDGPIDKTTGLPKWTIQVPEELRISAQSAANEMRGNLAREIYQAGAAKAGEWNQNAVNKILNARADKIKVAFSPEEQKAFHTLNVGGYLMPGTHGYEGAGQQMRRVGLIERNLERMAAGAGATIGGTIAGPVGTAVGTYVGQRAGEKAAGRIEVKSLRKAAEKSQEEMRKAAQMGKQTGLNKISDLGGK